MLQAQTSAALRDAGAQMALDFAGNDWTHLAVRLCREFYALAGPTGALFEDARNYALARGLPHPRSPNAWGAVSLMLARDGRIVRTGAFGKSKAVRSHARMQPLWRLA